MNQHTGKHDRFVDVHHTFSHAVRLSFNTKEHIAQYLINYIRRGRTYSEIRRNCQTFAADFCAFLAGKKVCKNVEVLVCIIVILIVNTISFVSHVLYFVTLPNYLQYKINFQDVQPFHPINKQMYRNQTHFFLYDSTMYRLT